MHREANVKDVLKSIVRGNLDKAASLVFVKRTLTIIDESADTKESLMAAALRISRRIDMLVDKDLAQSVYDSLMAAIEKIALPQGSRRRYKRVIFRKKVLVKYDGEFREMDSENISEGGMFLSTENPFPAGSEIEIALPLVGGRVQLIGLVLDKKEPFGEASRLQHGMAVEFKRVTDKEKNILLNHIQRTPD